MPTDHLRSLIKAELPRLIQMRRELHAHPELSNQEAWTSQYVQTELGRLGIKFKAKIAGAHGVIGHLPGKSKHAVALRADMDALPMDEATGKSYASQCPGVMHACGHDGHTAIQLGAAAVLSKLDARPHPMTLIFQPAEEDGGGAEKMCDAGCLKGDAGGGIGSPVTRIYGLHGWPSVPLGTVATRPGSMLAATDDFVVDFKGVGGHAAYPHLCKDPIVAAAAAVTALQSLASRSVSPFESFVCTVGQFLAGTANNIIPESARIVGTIRTLRPETRVLAKDRFVQIVSQTAQAHGCRADINYMEGYPVTANDIDETERFFSIAITAIGAGNAQRLEHPTMGGEDFAYYGRHVPACFFFLGLKPASVDRYPALHQPDFDFNDDAIAMGVEMMCRLAIAE
jgi:amidohydrolase